MDFKGLRAKLYQDTYLFDPEGYGRIFAFVDFANVKKIITVCARAFVSRELHDNSHLYIPVDPFKDLLDYSKSNTPGR